LYLKLHTDKYTCIVINYKKTGLHRRYNICGYDKFEIFNKLYKQKYNSLPRKELHLTRIYFDIYLYINRSKLYCVDFETFKKRYITHDIPTI